MFRRDFSSEKGRDCVPDMEYRKLAVKKKITKGITFRAFTLKGEQ